MTRDSRAFTLIELIVVVIIIAVLAAIAGLGYNTYVDHARTVAVRATAKQVDTALVARSTAADQTPGAVVAAALADAGGFDKYLAVSGNGATYATDDATTPKVLQVSVGSRAACLNLGTEPGQGSRISDGACGAAGKAVPDLAAVAGSADPTSSPTPDAEPTATTTPEPTATTTPEPTATTTPEPTATTTPEPVVGTVGFEGFNESYTKAGTGARYTMAAHSGSYAFGINSTPSTSSGSVTVTTNGGPLSFWMWRKYGGSTLTVDGVNVQPSKVNDQTWQQVTTGPLTAGTHTIAYTVTGTSSTPAAFMLDDIGPALMAAPAASGSPTFWVDDAGLNLRASSVANTGGAGTLKYTFTGDHGIGSQTSTATLPTVNFTNAAPDTVYTFTITASNDAGTSAPTTLTVRTAPALTAATTIGFETATASYTKAGTGARYTMAAHSGSYAFGINGTPSTSSGSVTVTTNGGPLSFWMWRKYGGSTLTVDGVNVQPSKVNDQTWQQVTTGPLTAGTHTIAYTVTGTSSTPAAFMLDDIGPVS